MRSRWGLKRGLPQPEGPLLCLDSCLCSQTSQDVCCVVFALFNVVWATLFLERWKRREAELAYRWGTLDTPAESLEEPRPQFRVRKEVARTSVGSWDITCAQDQET